MTQELPPLPEPAFGLLATGAYTGRWAEARRGEAAYDADQMRAYALQAIAARADAQLVAVRTRSKSSVARAAAMEPGTDPHWLWTATHGEQAVKTAQEMVKKGAWGHMEVQFLHAAAPAPRQPLSEEQIREACRGIRMYSGRDGLEAQSYDEAIARAIERAHGITEDTCPKT